MMRHFRSTLWVLLGVLSACAGTRCDSAKGSQPREVAAIQTPRPDLRLLITTDPRGYLEPCGCQVRPLGGLDKLASAVADARRDEVPTLLVSAGNIAFGTELRPEDAEHARAQEVMRAETFADVYKRIGFTAVAPGPLDAAQDEALVRSLVERGGFAWIADNAQAKEGSTPLAQGRVVDVKGIKVGLLGLSSPEAATPSPWLALDAELASVAEARIKALRAEGAQLVIALVSGDRRAARSVANKGADVVVMGGLNLEHALAPAIAGDAVMLHAGQQGQHLLHVDLGLKQPGTWEDASEWTRREAQKAIDAQAKELRTKIAAWEKDPKVAASDLDAQRARLTELERSLAEPPTPRFDKRWFRAELKELAPEVPGAKEIGALLDTHDKRVNDHNRVALADRKPLPAAPGAATFAGSESCASCHKEAYAWWRTTKHGNAYATLERVHKEFNLNCVGCHVTGYNQPGGSTVTHVDKLKDVGCESCHGPGSLHNAEPEKAGLTVRDTPESVCTTCHTHEHSDRFVYSSFKAMLIAPGHGRPVDRK